jgi:hypothetical protein
MFCVVWAIGVFIQDRYVSVTTVQDSTSSRQHATAHSLLQDLVFADHLTIVAYTDMPRYEHKEARFSDSGRYITQV